MNPVLVDPSAERAVLSGIFSYGEEAYLDVADIIQQSTAFDDETNQAMYQIFDHLISKRELKKLDQASVLSAAHELGFSHLFDRPDELAHIRSIMNGQIKQENVRYWAGHIRKLQIARLLKNQLSSAIVSIEQITGKESVDAIVSIAENAVFDFGELLNTGDDNDPVLIGAGMREHMRHLAKNPVEQIGLSSGYKWYDKWIGGGFRRKTVSLLGARTGVGKSMISDNVALHVATKLGIPVLYLDTEMSNEDHWYRLGGNLSNVDMELLETGKFGRDRSALVKVGKAIEELEQAPFYYKNISGKPFEETVSIMRRWIKQKVGFDENGKVKDCLIIYDYVKTMSSEGISAALQEYQVLGFMMTSLHNFAVKHDVPIFALVQLNRDGLDKETTGVVAGSDRIAWLATSVAIFKVKSDDEIAADGDENGTHKLAVIKSRHGGGTPHGDYLNLIMEGEVARVQEGFTKSELKYKQENSTKQEPTPVPPELKDPSDIPFGDLDGTTTEPIL